jgi:sugar-specific transcriptional regulator TrmB
MNTQDLDIMIKEINSYKRKIKDSQSKLDRMEGEKMQLINMKNELVKKTEEEFNMSMEELEENISKWEKSLRVEIDSIRDLISKEE